MILSCERKAEVNEDVDVKVLPPSPSHIHEKKEGLVFHLRLRLHLKKVNEDVDERDFGITGRSRNLSAQRT